MIRMVEEKGRGDKECMKYYFKFLKPQSEPWYECNLSCEEEKCPIQRSSCQ